MPAEFANWGLRFMFPENWELVIDEPRDASHGVTLFAPDGSFWSLAVYPAGKEPAALLRQVVDEMKREYDTLDCEPASQLVAGQPAQGYELNFIHLDLTCTCLALSFRTYRATFVLLSQAEDRDYERQKEVFRAISTSLKVS